MLCWPVNILCLFIHVFAIKETCPIVAGEVQLQWISLAVVRIDLAVPAISITCIATCKKGLMTLLKRWCLQNINSYIK